MILNKALLLKGLAGVTAVGATATATWYGVYSSRNNSPEIIRNAGLNCGTPSESGSKCTIDKAKLKVKQEDTKTEGFSSEKGSGKIKLYKVDAATGGYNQGFKLVIEGGDITLTGGSGSTTTLEEFETYEIEEEGKDSNKKYYLKRKDKAGKKIKELLGLPEGCSLPETSSSPSSPNCTINTTDIKKIKFEGISGEQTVTSAGDIELTVTKLTPTDSHFPLNYKFEFKGKNSSATLNINSKTITLETSKATEFRIKKISDNKLTLEEAWSLENLAEEVNLTCNSNNICAQIPGKTTNVKQDSSIYDNKTLTTSDSGKIKVYTTEATDYNKDFRFVIEGGDVSTSVGTSQKLEEFETYEIKKDSDKWYFSRKTKAEEGIKKALGLDGISNCNLPTSVNTTTTCTPDTENLKKIKFDGKGTEGATVTSGTTPTLKISITSGQEKTQFPFGYKFTLESNEDITISSTAPTKSIKKNTNTEFKIKATTAENTTARTLSLEKAWDITKLAKKIGLTNCSETGDKKECDLGEKINLYVSSSDKTEEATVTGSNKKIKYEEDAADHNQGFKFTVESEISLNSAGSGEKKIENNSATYEIKEIGGKWYLAKKQ